MYFKVNAKSKKVSSKGEIRGIILILLSFLLGYCLVIPSQAGAVGQSAARLAFLFFGKAAFVSPLILFWWGWGFLRNLTAPRWRMDLIFGILVAALASTFFSIFSQEFYHLNYGGWIGIKLAPFFRRLFGVYISLLVVSGLLVYIASLLLHVSLKRTIIIIWYKLVEDYQNWQKARAELRKQAPSKIKSMEAPRRETAAPVFKESTEKETKPKIIVAPPQPETTIKKQKETPKKPVLPAEKTARKPESVVMPGTQAVVPIPYALPSLDLLSTGEIVVQHSHEEHLSNAELLTKTLENFNITSKVKEIIPGPVVTRYDIELAPGIKIQAVSALSDNIALTMKVPSVRIVPVPEKSAVGIEVPNGQSRIVGLKGIMASPEFQNSKSLLTLGLGRTTDGVAYVTDLAPMPHLLIAGATGSGKSVGIHSIITSILYKAKPDEVKFLLIDPKRLELPVYRGIPHIYDPRVPAEQADIITQPKEAAASLKKLVRVMEMRYEKFAHATVRNIAGYNEKMAATGGQKEFYIVVIIDELADLMLIATRDVEDSIQRLAQMARAVGIHLILATQRPSVDVITGVIKANFPARIAFQTTSKVDSRVILDTIGAEDLFGKGDMLFVPPGESRQTRLQGGFVSMKEVENIVQFIIGQKVPSQYEDLFAGARVQGGVPEEDDDKSTKDLYRALMLVQERKRVSQDLLKAHFGSSARATNVLSLLETKGFINKPEGTNRWQIHFDKIDEYLASAPPLEN